MTIVELRKALEHLPDDMPVVYEWTWLSPKDVCIGKRRGNGPTECLLLDGNLSEGAKRLGNIVLWQEVDKQNEVWVPCDECNAKKQAETTAANAEKKRRRGSR